MRDIFTQVTDMDILKCHCWLSSHWKTHRLDQNPLAEKKRKAHGLLCWGNKDELKTHADRLYFTLLTEHLKFSLICLSLAQQKVKKRNREFYLRRRGFAIFNFSYFSHRINVENCVNDSTWISQIIKRKTVAWKLDELNYHNIYFSQTGGSREEHFYICRFSLDLGIAL